MSTCTPTPGGARAFAEAVAARVEGVYNPLQRRVTPAVDARGLERAILRGAGGGWAAEALGFAPRDALVALAGLVLLWLFGAVSSATLRATPDRYY